MTPSTQRMTAAVLYGREQLRIENVEVPKLAPGDILVRVRAALTCGTDVKVFRRGYHARMIRPPALFGHELAGDIVDVPTSGAKRLLRSLVGAVVPSVGQLPVRVIP